MSLLSVPPLVSTGLRSHVENTIVEAHVPPELLTPIEPVWPADAAQRRIEGVVWLAVTVRTDGRIDGVEFVTGNEDPSLVEAAEQSVAPLTFQPAKRRFGDQEYPVRSRVYVKVAFDRVDIR